MKEETLFEVKELTKKFESVIALHRIHLCVRRGEWVVLAGPSGSGKTTLLHLLAFLDSPSSGEYVFEGSNMTGLQERERLMIRRDKIGLVFQQFYLIPYLTALENVMLAQYFHSVTDKSEAEAALTELGLGHRLRHLPSQLSGGERQRVCIARALINDPSLILADEPTGNLDEANEKIVIEIFKQLHEKGKTIVFVSHDEEIQNYSDRVVKLHHGKIESIIDRTP